MKNLTRRRFLQMAALPLVGTATQTSSNQSREIIVFPTKASAKTFSESRLKTVEINFEINTIDVHDLENRLMAEFKGRVTP